MNKYIIATDRERANAQIGSIRPEYYLCSEADLALAARDKTIEGLKELVWFIADREIIPDNLVGKWIDSVLGQDDNPYTKPTREEWHNWEPKELK